MSGAYTARKPSCAPQLGREDRGISQFKNPSSTEFPFSSFSHKLSMDERKEFPMSAFVFAILLLIRVILPISILFALGEWVHCRDANYWFRG